jgi:galactonate dehydratase
VGERLHTRFDFVPIFEDRLANYVMPDPCWTGGLSELKKIAVLAEAHFVPIAPHGAAGPLQVFASGHVMKTVPNLYRLEILGPSAISKYNEFLSEPITIRNGQFIVPEGPGLGIDLDWDRVRAHPHPDLA